MNGNIKDLDIQKVEAWLAKKRPPIDIRPQLDYTYRLQRNTFILCEVRPYPMMKDGYRTAPFAKIHYLKRSNIYLIYWQRANGRWLNYEAGNSATTLNDALAIIDEDVHGCFYG
ncbi:hypothetical protein GGR28_003437 [Lewinella aquimaris]|uniref:DUF3024 domain-containing protein n=1 Tax=Neolewinella aquimaris TaxID=1835722 RepID=A0A840EAR1_9BACT|nr:DUF3024 domain-containing protein [Neolewinella aquimaris]MBB4080802.1 hypothetical protein [Neolewinella aquimaris]